MLDWLLIWFFGEMVAELARREKEANIKLDPDIDIYVKVSKNATSMDLFSLGDLYVLCN